MKYVKLFAQLKNKLIQKLMQIKITFVNLLGTYSTGNYSIRLIIQFKINLWNLNDLQHLFISNFSNFYHALQ